MDEPMLIEDKDFLFKKFIEYHNLQDTEKYTRDHNLFAMCMEKLDKLKELKEGK